MTTAMIPPSSSSAVAAFGRGTIRIQRRKSVLVVALSRPKVKNAFSAELYLDLIEILHATSLDDSLSALVLTGTGSYFSSGADLKKGTFLPEDGSARVTIDLPAGRFMMALLGFPKIIAAAVQGPAVGIGVTLLLHCDLCYCTDTATFWAPFTRLALVPELCSSTTLIETMGLSKANELLLLGKKIDAKTSVQWNICSQLLTGCDQSGDPFHFNSLASKVAEEIDERLLSLPRGNRTAEVFVSLVRGRRQARLQQICREELRVLDQRFNDGETLEAVMQLNIGSQKKSKL